MTSRVSHTDLLKDMLAIPAVSREEKKRADFLESYLTVQGYAVTRHHNNLLVGETDPGSGLPRVLLNSHLDTVKPVSGWETDPFLPVENNGKITGLGSNDAGASVVSMISAFCLMQKKLVGKLQLMLLISAEEEVSGSRGISSVMEILGKLDAVIVGEPTGMQPAVAERGLMVLDGAAKGVAGHAARKEGENAIYRALQDVESIRSLTFPEPSKWLPEASAQVTMISAGTGHNVVPDLCTFVVDVRSNDRYGNESLLGIIQEACTTELLPRSTRLKPSSLNEDHPLMQAIKSCTLKPFGSSTLSDMALIPYPSIKMGPGDSARSHTAGEFIYIREIEEAVDTYCRFLEELEPALAGS